MERLIHVLRKALTDDECSLPENVYQFHWLLRVYTNRVVVNFFLFFLHMMSFSEDAQARTKMVDQARSRLVLLITRKNAFLYGKTTDYRHLGVLLNNSPGDLIH